MPAGGPYSAQIQRALRAYGFTSGGSLVLSGDLTVGGIGYFANGTVAAPSMAFASQPGLGFYKRAANVLGVADSGYSTDNALAVFSPSGIVVGDGVLFGWASGADAGGTIDLSMFRNAANFLVQRNGTNAQRASWANTYVSAANNETFSVDWQTTANVAMVGTRTAATGTGRVLRLYAQGSSAGAGGGIIELSPTGGVMVSATAPSDPVACTSPSVTWSNGTAAFQIDVGTTCAAVTTLVVTLPAVTNAWSCLAMNVGASATAAIEMTASTTTSATFTNYTRTTGIALAWVDGADVRISCLGG